MFDRIFANYLVESGKLTADKLDSVFSSQEQKRVRLGVIAVSEKLMTIDQVEEVNQLQAVCDKRFGDIAIEKGYLDDEQVKRLLKLQANAFLVLIQAIEDAGLLSMAQIDEALNEYQKKNSLTLSNMEDLKSCDIDRIIPIFVYEQNDFVNELCGVMVRTVSRLVDYHVFIDKPYLVKDYPYELLCTQELVGQHNFLTSLSGSSEALVKAAYGFAGEQFIDTTEDALDALCELINCVNGLFATELSSRDVMVDMEAPHYYEKSGTLKADEILCLPMMIFGKKINVLITFNQKYSL